jgi:malonyl-CoA/methylmalonyl-CoA synthetase
MASPIGSVGRPAWASHLPAGVDPASVDLLAQESLPRAWAAQLARAPEAPVVRMAGDGQWLTAGELDARSRTVAARFAAAGLRPGERVLFSAGASVELVVAYVAAHRLGLVVVPVNTAYTERELDHIVGDAEPAAAVVDDEQRAQWLADVRAVWDPSVEVAGDTGDPPPLDQATRDDLALIGYTSGTTGAPKGAMLSSGNLLASAEALRIAWRWSPEDRLVLALPLFHMHGLGVGLHGTLVAGASTVLLPRFDVDAVLDAAAAHDATLFFGVPTMYTRLAGSPRAAELARLRLLVSGSAPLPSTLHERLQALTGQRVLERYGMTETAMNVSNPYDGERRAGSVGLPLPGVELRLERGEVLLRGPNVFAGYWRRPDATAEAFDPAGWFRTGDLAEQDDDGYLRIVGRSKELIISGGFNVYPREVEDVLRQHPSVADVAVAGVPSEEWGETVVAWVVPAAGSSEGGAATPAGASKGAEADTRAAPFDPDALLAFAAGRLAGYKRPRQVHTLEQLPRNALGKVVKGDLPGRS